MEKKTLRLLLWADCNRNCPKCCNNDHAIEQLPTYQGDYSEFEMVILTGGEPMLYPQKVLEIIREIRQTSEAKIIMYTALYKFELMDILGELDGITFTLHDSESFIDWLLFTDSGNPVLREKTLRVNVFPADVHGWEKLGLVPLGWKIKEMEWIDNCPLPQNEVFMKYKF